MSSFVEMAPPLIAFGTCARWFVNGFEFYQFSPATTDPYKDVAPFIKKIVPLAMTTEATANGKLPVPGYGEMGVIARNSESWRRGLPEDNLVRIMFAYWPEISLLPPKRNGKIAYDWKVWWDASGMCEASFRRYDEAGRPVPIHDIPRKPLDELIEDLGTSANLEMLNKWL